MGLYACSAAVAPAVGFKGELMVGWFGWVGWLEGGSVNGVRERVSERVCE